MKKAVSLHRNRKDKPSEKELGEMVEWSITAVLKTAVLRGTGGSNPSLSAINAENQQITKQTPSFTPKNVKLGVFLFIANILSQFYFFYELQKPHYNERGF